MAISKERKVEILDQYREWIEKSKAVFLAEYTGLNMKQIDDLRAKIREAGGEFHVIKNTFGKMVFDEAGFPDAGHFEGSTAAGFAFEDPPGVAKVLSEFAKTSDFVIIKGGFLGMDSMTEDQVQALAKLPPLPIVRAQLLGVLQAPAGKLARLIAEPGRQVAAVIKARADKEGAAA